MYHLEAFSLLYFFLIIFYFVCVCIWESTLWVLGNELRLLIASAFTHGIIQIAPFLLGTSSGTLQRCLDFVPNPITPCLEVTALALYKMESAGEVWSY